MKRSLITTLIIGVAVALIVGALHATKVIAGLRLLPRNSSPIMRARHASSAKNGNTSFVL
jgi:hypothetical protein